jgi:hypothetical protein
MPAKSQAQRKWAFGVKGKKWAKAHHYDNPGKLPARVKPKKKGKKKRKS